MQIKTNRKDIHYQGIFLIVTLLVYPATWSNPEVETVCGKEVCDLTNSTYMHIGCWLYFMVD